MADAYSYDLLVEVGENKVPKLKIKLVKYFQSKKSNGGDCEVDYENGSSTAVLHFRTEKDQQNVLRKREHEISLGKEVLKVKVRLISVEKTKEEAPPEEVKVKRESKADIGVIDKQLTPDESKLAASVPTEAEGTDDETAEEELGPTSAVIEKLPESLHKDFLPMLVENVLRDAGSPSTLQNITLEVLPGVSSAVVTFQSGKENSDFMARVTQNRAFKSKGLSVRPLEPTEQVLVKAIRNYGEDVLYLYFDHEGGDVENVVLNEVEKTAVITFKDHQAVDKITKKKHYIREEEIRVYPFYKSLGTALYGKDRPSLKLPAEICVPIDNALWRYMNENQSAAETIHTDLAKHFCSVKFQKTNVCLSPVSSLLRQKDAEAIIPQWTDKVKSAFAQALSKFKSLKLLLESEAWDEAEKKIRQTLLNENVVVVPDRESGALSVVGLLDDVNRLEKTLCEVVKQIVKTVMREKRIVPQRIQMSHPVFHILCQNGLEEKVVKLYPELKMSFRKESSELILSGLREEILEAQTIVYDELMSMKRRNLEMDNFVLDLLKAQPQEELTNLLLTSSGINAAFQTHTDRVELVAMSNTYLNDAEHHLGKMLTSQYIDVEDTNVLGKPECQDLISQLENTDKESCQMITIRINGPQVVVVSGLKDIVVDVSRDLGHFLDQNANVEEDVVVKPNIIVEYLHKHETSWLKQMNDKVKVTFRKEAIHLSGSRLDVADCKTVVDASVSNVCFKDFKVNKPGVKNFFHNNEGMYVQSIMTETGCLAKLIDETGGGLDHVAGPVYKLQTSDGVEIVVCKADMCSYPVDAVVNSSNQDLKHSGGLSAALLVAAGPQLQDECDKIIKTRGQLKPGECVVTGAGGQLCCKKVIHVVGPNLDRAKPQMAVEQLIRAVKGSLALAEKCSCVSVALPAISRNLGFPLQLCADTIIEAVKKYCEDRFGECTLKRIHLVNNDDSAVQALGAAFKQKFGNAVSHSEQVPIQASKSLPVKQTGSDPNSLAQVMTKEGVCITLTKGNIEDSTTEVIVNTVGEDLALDKGAVSIAILRAAGPDLQPLVNAENATGTVGEVIVTDGCNLRSKKVFHVVAPFWNQGQAAAEKLLGGIFKDCLGKAEDSSLTSISFPAIGTGNLGFPRDRAASLMLDEFLAFSTNRSPTHLKCITIVLYSGDARTIQVFSDEFKKKFSTPSVGPVPSGSPQMSGLFSKITSSSGMHEAKIGGVAVQLVTGDITMETTDVIVNSSNEKFSLKSGVSKAILETAGQAVEAECQNLGAEPNPGIIMTQPGNLKCKKILHLVGYTDPVKIRKLVTQALEMCSKKSYTSISFPAIGTGQGNAKAKHVADAMLDAVIDMLSSNTSSTLNTIRIVIFQKPMLKEFQNSMQEREGNQPKQKGFWGNLFQAFTGGGSADKPKDRGDFVIEALQCDPTRFHICGKSRTSVDSAKDWINDLISKECASECIEDSAILSLSAADHKFITDIQKKFSVSIKTERKKSQATITIDGISKDVLQANREVRKMLTRIEEQLKKELESSSVDRLPNHWDAMPANASCHCVTINTGTPEYTEVENLFKATCKDTITKIERIQNPVLWKTLLIKKLAMDKRNGHQNNEKRLFHGTSHDIVPTINANGFNRSYAGRNATCYGKGTYFAVKASYSAGDTYSKPNPQGDKCMYLCRVLTGDYALADAKSFDAPIKPGSTVQKYDSTVDNMAAPNMFVIFHDTHACPEYLITFRK